MPKYITMWEMDMSRVSNDPKERATAMTMLIEMTKEWLKNNPGTEWGIFLGESKGYTIGEKTFQDVAKSTLAFAPYVKNVVYQALSINEFEDIYKSVMSMRQQK
jgi:hypothetical protein